MDKMNKRVALEGRVEAVGVGGLKAISYPSVASVWAAIKPVAQPATVRGGRLEMPISHRITIPYHATYLQTRQVRFGARVFEVISLINPNEANEKIILQCMENI